MESRFLQKLIIAVLLFSCSTEPKTPLPLDKRTLQNGDLLYRYGSGVFSKYFRQVSDSVQTYSHVGFVHITLDSIHVIHSEASELTFVGYVRRDPIEKWLNDVRAWGVYRLDQPDSIRNAVVDVALAYHRRRVPFDMDFSLKDDEEIYCTELIGLCINQGVGQNLVKPATVIMGKMGYSVDDTFLADGIFKVTSSEELQ